MPSDQQIRSVIKDYFKAIRDGDLEAWVNTFAEDAVAHDPVGAPPSEGHDGLRQFFQNIGNAFDRVALYEEDIYVSGPGAAVKWRGEGVGKGGGKEVQFAGIDTFEVNDDGKIQNQWAFWNPGAVMAELQG